MDAHHNDRLGLFTELKVSVSNRLPPLHITYVYWMQSFLFLFLLLCISDIYKHSFNVQWRSKWLEHLFRRSEFRVEDTKNRSKWKAVIRCDSNIFGQIGKRKKWNGNKGLPCVLINFAPTVCSRTLSERAMKVLLTSRSTVVAKLTASFWLQLTAFCRV